ncbi:MAG: NAD(P)/FAD-dependent oxidoreductase [Candidatus Aenigmatarchaeota archaeon]
MIIIIGAGISGLSLSYFLSSFGIKNLVIEMKKDVGIKNRSTCLVSSKIFRLLKVLSKNIILKNYRVANFWYENKKIFSVKSKKEMFLLDYLQLEKEIFNNIDKTFSNFLFEEKVLDVNFDKNILITNKRKIKFEYIIDATGTFSFLANKFNLFKFKKIFNSFEILAIPKKKFENINIFFDKKISKTKFGWYIDLNGKSLIGLIDQKLNFQKFSNFIKKFEIVKTYYSYSHPILYCELKKLRLKNSLIIGEAAGLIKPFSLGGITYGIISSYIAAKTIKNNEIEKYEDKIRKIFLKSIILGKFIDKILKYKVFLQTIYFFKLNNLFNFLDPDFMNINI